MAETHSHMRSLSRTAAELPSSLARMRLPADRNSCRVMPMPAMRMGKGDSSAAWIMARSTYAGAGLPDALAKAHLFTVAVTSRLKQRCRSATCSASMPGSSGIGKTSVTSKRRGLRRAQPPATMHVGQGHRATLTSVALVSRWQAALIPTL